MKTRWNAAVMAITLALGVILIGSQTAIAQDYQDAYNMGYRYGRSDKRENRNSDFKRYKREYNGRTKNDFRRGYEDGYRDASNDNWGGVWNRDRYNDREWGRGNASRNVPRWMVGTFRGYTPSNDTYTQITVSADGYITIAAENGSGYSQGYYRDGTVFFQWGQYTFRREGNGFRAVNQGNSNDRVYYQKVN